MNKYRVRYNLVKNGKLNFEGFDHETKLMANSLEDASLKAEKEKFICKILVELISKGRDV